MEAIFEPVRSWPRKGVTAAAAGFALAVAGVGGVEVVALDEQAVVKRPKPSMAVRTEARCRGPTVLPPWRVRALHGPLK